jgi:hypothetical protein
VKALAQLKGESDENEKIPETENSEKTAFSKTRQINAAPQRDLFLRCGIDFLRCSMLRCGIAILRCSMTQCFPAPVKSRKS